MSPQTILTIRRGALMFIIGFFVAVVWVLNDYPFGELWSMWFFLGFIFLFLAVIRRHYYFLLLGLCLLGISTGLVKTINAFPIPNPDFEQHLNQKVSFVGQVVDDPDQREKNVLLLIQPDNSQEQILVNAGLDTNIEYGDEVKISGTLARPQNFTTDTGREFDYIDYLKVRQVQYIVDRAHAQLVSPGSWWSLYRNLFALKHVFIQNLNNVLPEPESALAAGLVVGAKQGLGKDWQAKFREAGLVHVVVLSGYNITIVAEQVLRLAVIVVPRYLAFSVSGVSVILFALLVGGGPTVLRASIMALLALWARATGRSSEASKLLLLAGFIMVFTNPLVLLFDIGFQLSFLSTIGLIYVSPVMMQYLTWLPDRFGLREIISSTLATQLFVLPLLVYAMGQVSLVGLFVNILVLPLVPFSMLTIFIAGMLDFGGFIVALPFATVSLVILRYILTVVTMATALPFAAVLVPQISVSLVVLWYSGYLLGLYYWYYRKFSTMV